ncbi:MAG: hypothetical protein RIC35_24485 [Marinoscillum sp.]
MSLAIGSFGTLEEIEAISVKLNHTITALDASNESLDFNKVKSFLESSSEEFVLIVDVSSALIQGTTQGYIGEFEWRNIDIFFAASANFQFNNPRLEYYFWKYYPRNPKHTYHYLDARGFIGKRDKLLNLFTLIEHHYNTKWPLQDLLNRWFVEYALGVVPDELKVKLDHHQDLFGCLDGRVSAFKFPMVSWIHEHLFYRYETDKLTESNQLKHQHQLWDISYSKRRSFSFNGKLKSTPSIFLRSFNDNKSTTQSRLANSPPNRSLSVFFTSLGAYVKSLFSTLIAWIINRGESRLHKIFRYVPNASPEWDITMKQFLKYLDSKKGFTFAHFNDGEMTFIKKFLKQDHRETWFGRRQQKYNKKLGERLTNALKLKRERYHVGIPCSTSHPKLRKLANQIVETQDGVVPAMTLHHNLRFYPNIIGHMKDRECFFIMNEHQKLDVLEELGVTVKDENKTIVPFKNSYLLFDELKDKKFPDGAIVILICGMLAKIIIPEWFANNPNTTFLALGSSMDDFIQRTNTKFRLYPKSGLPLTCNIQPTKFFAFGWKKSCKECWDMQETIPEVIQDQYP